jgi:hypothetical protein
MFLIIIVLSLTYLRTQSEETFSKAKLYENFALKTSLYRSNRTKPVESGWIGRVIALRIAVASGYFLKLSLLRSYARRFLLQLYILRNKEVLTL